MVVWPWARKCLPAFLVLASATGIAIAHELRGRFGFALLITCGAGMLVGAATLDRGVSSRGVWLIGASLALIGLSGQPLFEDDFYRYLWDGYRTATAGTPYGAAPEAYFADVDVPEKFRSVLDRINNPEVPTIYGPMLQGLFYLGYLVDPANERILRIFWCVANLTLVGMLLHRYPAHRVALYAWNPLVFKEVCLSGH